MSNGLLTLNADGSFSYDPAPGFVGSDSFTYQANDGSVDSDVATVNITVNPSNDAAVAVDDAYRKGHLKETGVENLQLITCGVLPPNPSDLMVSQRMGQVLDSLNEMADVVILDSPPAVAFADAMVLANRMDGVVLVAQAGQTRRDVARQAVLNLQQAGAHFLGAVLNRVSQKEGHHVYYRYYSLNRGEPVGQLSYARLRQRLQWLALFSNNTLFLHSCGWHRPLSLRVV